uniref:PAT complex subunit Asterix n=1 Tax=Gadus morhua TaxID=8049 RepID=A0A8C5CZE3_GADMO
MTSNNMNDPRRQNKILRYKPPSTEANPTLEDPTPDYMNLLGMIFSMCGLMLKLKWCAWIAVYCSFISFANSRSSEDTKQMMSSFMMGLQGRSASNQPSDAFHLSGCDVIPSEPSADVAAVVTGDQSEQIS